MVAFATANCRIFGFRSVYLAAAGKRQERLFARERLREFARIILRTSGILSGRVRSFLAPDPQCLVGTGTVAACSCSRCPVDSVAGEFRGKSQDMNVWSSESN